MRASSICAVTVDCYSLFFSLYIHPQPLLFDTHYQTTYCSCFDFCALPTFFLSAMRTSFNPALKFLGYGPKLHLL